jgi:hypothetical protein
MLKIVVLLGLALVYSKASIQATQPTDEQQCQGWRRNSNKKAPRLTKDDGLLLLLIGLEGHLSIESLRLLPQRLHLLQTQLG